MCFVSSWLCNGCASVGVDLISVYLTWNFKHIANPVQLPVMRGLCAAKGYQLPELVSPLELLEIDDE
jgi:hypothetical protein